VRPRPAQEHLRATVRLDRILGQAFDDENAPFGGWTILVEPEIHFLRKVEVDVPDLAGRRRARLPVLPETAFFETVPDWICELLSPETARLARTVKRPIYTRYGVSHAWLIDPNAQVLETYRLHEESWLHTDRFAAAEIVAPASFDAILFSLNRLWS